MRHEARGSLPMAGGSAMLRLLLWPIWRRFEAAARDPETTQRLLWSEIARECEGSPFWQARWGQTGAPPLADLPITEYSDYRSAFDAAYEGGFAPTTTAPVGYWAVSSGTTAAKPKRFPFVAGNARQRLAASAPIGAYLHRLSVVEPRIPAAPILILANGGTHASPSGVPTGYATAYFLARAPSWVDRMLAVPRIVYTRPELWRDWAPLYAVARDLGLIWGISAAWIGQFHESLRTRMDDYWPYLEGRSHPPPPLPRVRIRPQRLAHLRDVFRATAPTLRDVWPGLAAVLCWTGASSAAQVPLLEPWLGGASLRDYVYVCTECAMTVPLHDGEDGHPLHPGSGIVELLPAGAEPSGKHLLRCWEAEPGRDYEVFLTTVNGLVRYRLHDIVRCTGRFRRTPRLAFRSKTAYLLKVTSTAIPEDEVVRVLRHIGYRSRDDLLLGPHPSGRAIAMYVREGSDAGRLAESLDRALRAVTTVYEVERSSGILGPIEAIPVPASHPMWAYRNREQAKSRYILREAPRDVPAPRR